MIPERLIRAIVDAAGLVFEDTMRIEVEPFKVTIVTLNRDADGKAYFVGSDVATTTTEFPIIREVNE